MKVRPVRVRGDRGTASAPVSAQSLQPIGIVENSRCQRAGWAAQTVSGAGEDKLDVAELREGRARWQCSEAQR
jgi:hypothetical protein